MKRSNVGGFLKDLNEKFAREIAGLPMSKKVRADLAAGFADGARSAVLALEYLGEVKLEADANTTEAAE